MAIKRTVRGNAIPDHLAHAVPSALTDESIQERNKRPQRVKGAAQVTADPDFQKKLQRMEREVYMGVDPFAEVIEEQKQKYPDKSFRFLSDRVVRKNGTRGWEREVDERGDPIQVGGMTLASMPKQLADLRNEKYRRLGAEQLAEARENQAEKQEQITYEAERMGIEVRPLAPNTVVTDSVDPSQSISIGFESHRGGY